MTLSTWTPWAWSPPSPCCSTTPLPTSGRSPLPRIGSLLATTTSIVPEPLRRPGTDTLNQGNLMVSISLEAQACKLTLWACWIFWNLLMWHPPNMIITCHVLSSNTSMDKQDQNKTNRRKTRLQCQHTRYLTHSMIWTKKTGRGRGSPSLPPFWWWPCLLVWPARWKCINQFTNEPRWKCVIWSFSPSHPYPYWGQIKYSYYWMAPTL